MTQPTFRYVEDYIEFIAGYRDHSGSTYNFFTRNPSPINLARYDVSIVESFASQTDLSKQPYTDRQAALAVKIVDKYRRQLSKLTPPVTVPEVLDQFKLGIRKVDRATAMTLANDRIHLKFPYNKDIIAMVSAFRSSSHGSMFWNAELRVWDFALSEYNLTVALTVARKYNFEYIDPALLELEQQILAIENDLYEIKLVQTDTGYAITNAADSLTEYIVEHLGGFGADNRMRLVDNAAVLGYTVDPEIFASVPEALRRYMSDCRTVKIAASDYYLDEIVEYARLLDRLPVYVYTTDIPRPDTDAVKYLNKGKGVDIVPKLMVSTSALMIGNKKQAWLANAERVIIVE